MAGPGKGGLKKFGFKQPSGNHDIPKPQKSSSIRDVLHKSSSSRDVQPPHKSSGSRDVQQPHKSSNSNAVCKGQTYFQLQDEELPKKNSNLEEDHTEEDYEVNSQQTDTYSSSPREEENFGSTSVGMFIVLVVYVT